MRLLKRVLLGIVVLLAAFVIFLVAAILLDAAIGADRLDHIANTTIPGVNG